MKKTRDHTHLNKYNLTRRQREALKDLENDHSIVIKPADKGGAIVIMYKNEYEEECLRHLNNRDQYQPTDQEEFKLILKKIEDTINRVYTQGYIDEAMAKVLSPKNTKPSNFYT